jgi:hypothetical protein
VTERGLDIEALSPGEEDEDGGYLRRENSDG